MSVTCVVRSVWLWLLLPRRRCGRGGTERGGWQGAHGAREPPRPRRYPAAPRTDPRLSGHRSTPQANRRCPLEHHYQSRFSYAMLLEIR
eukprot:1371325-Rhodomonas_salina.1